MENPYIRETIIKLRHAELLCEAQHRRLIAEYNVGRTRALDRPSTQQRTRMVVRAMFAMLQAVLIREAG